MSHNQQSTVNCDSEATKDAVLEYLQGTPAETSDSGLAVTFTTDAVTFPKIQRNALAIASGGEVEDSEDSGDEDVTKDFSDELTDVEGLTVVKRDKKFVLVDEGKEVSEPLTKAKMRKEITTFIKNLNAE